MIFTSLMCLLLHSSISLSIEVDVSKWPDENQSLVSDEANRIISLVCNYYSAIENSDSNAIENAMHFDNDKQREIYLSKSMLHRMAWGLPSLEHHTIYFVTEANSAPLEEYVFLIPYKGERYSVNVLKTVEIDGVLKLRCPYSADELMLSSSERHIAQVKKKLEAWKKAQNENLAEKVQDFKRSWHDQIKAWEYAKKHGIKHVTPINETLPEIVAMHKKIDEMDEAELCSGMIEGYEKEIEQDNQRKQRAAERAARSENANQPLQ